MSKRKYAKRPKVASRTGRKPLSHHGLERRSRKVLVSFTPTEFAAVELAADDEGVTVSELIAQRAVGAL